MANRNRSLKNALNLTRGYGWGRKGDAKRAASKLYRLGGKFEVAERLVDSDSEADES